MKGGCFPWPKKCPPNPGAPPWNGNWPWPPIYCLPGTGPPLIIGTGGPVKKKTVV